MTDQHARAATHGQDGQGGAPPARRPLIRGRWPKPVGNDTVDLAEAMDAQEQGDTLRAAQIQAVRDTMGWGQQPDAFNEQAVADTAAEVVDAMLAAGGLCGQTSESLLLGHPPLVCTMPAGHLGQWHGDDNGSRWTPQTPTPEWERKLLAAQQQRDDQAEARGYAAAVANLRDDQGYREWRWPGEAPWALPGNKRIPSTFSERTARHHAADYLEAVGPGPYAPQGVSEGSGVHRPTSEAQKSPQDERATLSRGTETEAEPTWRVGRHLGRTLYRNGQLQGLLDDPALAQHIADMLNAAQGEVTTQGRTGADGHTAGRGEGACTCPLLDASTWTGDAQVKGYDPNCPTCGLQDHWRRP